MSDGSGSGDLISFFDFPVVSGLVLSGIVSDVSVDVEEPGIVTEDDPEGTVPRFTLIV